MTIRVLVADDHTIVREGLKRILADGPEIEVVAEAADTAETVARARDSEPDVVLLDINMPGRGGIDALREMKSSRPSVRVLVLSMHPEDQFAVRCLREGADGYMTKETAPEKLLDAIRKLHRGGKYVSPALAERLVSEVGHAGEGAPHERLSSREFEVLRRIAAGRTVSEISEELALSVKTISTYRSRILEKMNLRNNAEIMRYAMERGLVE